MRFPLIEVLLWSLVIQLLYASDIPTLDLRNGINSNTIPTLKVDKEHQLFRIIITANPSTGYRWFDIRNPRSNCIPLVTLRGKNYQRSKGGPLLMGQKVTEVLTYETNFIGKQQILLVQSRSQPSSNDYESLNKIGKNTYPIIIEIGEKSEQDTCQG